MAVETITTVLVPAAATPPAGAYDLTDLATARDELSIPSGDTSNDGFLSRAITQVSRAIQSYCGRVFQVEMLEDLIYIQQDAYPWQVPGGVYPLQLSRWPLNNYAVIAFTGATHASTTVDGIASTAGLVAGTPVFAADGSVPAGALIQTVNANSIVLTKAATSSETGLAFTTGVQVVQTLSVDTTQTLVYGQDFKIDADRGWLIRINSWTDVSQKWEAEPVTVRYQAGFASVPPDIAEACLRLVTARFRARGRDPMLAERTQATLVGTERYWVGAAPGQTGQFPNEIAGILDRYRVPVIG